MNQPREYGQRLNAAMIEAIDRARWDAKIRSARALAERAGMTHTYLNQRLNGVTPFTVRDLGAIAYALGVTPDDLLMAAIDALSDPAPTRALAADDTVGRDEEAEADDTP